MEISFLIRASLGLAGPRGRFHHWLAVAAVAMLSMSGFLHAVDMRPNAVAFRQMKYGIFVTQAYGLTGVPAGQPVSTFDEYANAFDVQTFANQVAAMGVEYVYFTAWHKSIYCLGPNNALERWLPGHTSKRDVLGEIADALQTKHIKLVIYAHPNDGHDLTVEEQARVGYWDATNNYQTYNDFTNEVAAEVCDRYASKPNVIGFWWDSWWYRVPMDMTRLRATVMAKFPGAITLSNMQDANFIDFLSIEGASMGSLNGVAAYKDNLTWYVAGDWWNGGGGSISISPEDMYRFTLLNVGTGAPGGMSWALSPMADGKTWGSNNQPLTVMQALGNHIAPVRRTICNVLPSHNWVLPTGTTWAQAPAYVAARNPVTQNEYVHVLKPPGDRFIDLPLPVESFTSARMYLSQSPVTMDVSGGALRLTLPAAESWSALDTVIELTTSATGFPPAVTITFQSNGGSAVASQTVMSGEIAMQPVDPVMTGSTFMEWCIDSGLTTAFDFSTPITSNTTLYGKWALNCTVTFDSTGGSAVTSQSVASGRTATSPADPTLTGYTFVEWCADSGLSTAFDFSTPITSNTTLYAKWVINYTVTFDSKGGSAVASQSVASGRTATLPTPAPTQTGRTLVGWYADSGLTTAFDFGTAITSNRTLYAKWTIANYTVGFDSNGGSAVSSQTVTYNTTATRPALDPTRTGYTFSGWYGDENLTELFDFATLITGDTTLYARWALPLQYASTTNGDNQVLTFTAGSGTWTVPAGVASLKVLVVGGGGGGQYYGGGGGGGGVYSTTSYAVTAGSSVTVTVGAGGAGGLARVQDVPPYPHAGAAVSGESSTFGSVAAYGGSGGNWVWTNGGAGYGQGGASGGNNQGAAGIVADLPGASYGSGSGAGVKGTANGSNSDAGGAGLSNSITGSLLWYAGGGGALVQGPGGAGGGANGSATSGTAAVAAVANRGGGGGGGWAAAGGNGGSGVVIVSYLTSGGGTTYTVSFNSNDGSAVTSQSVAAGGTATQPTPAPTKTGYTFAGWFSDAGLTTSFDFATAITSDKTLYAKWTSVTYTVSFNSNGGSCVTSQSVAAGGTATQPTPVPTKTSYAFAGWYADAGLTTSFDFATIITSDKTLYAKWGTAITPTYSTRADGYTLATFAGGTGTWTIPAHTGNLRVLVVGGGGGGGAYGGGGGGGAVLYNGSFTPSAGEVSITVGLSGAGGSYTGGVRGSGAPGGASVFDSITANGGGGGSFTGTATYIGGASGSGIAGVSGTYASGSGAGGAGLSNGDPSVAGGAGLSSAITGSTLGYGGGGGALVHGPGADGGGNGSAAFETAALPAVANRGGGGGSGWGAAGGAGGSGVVIVAYLGGMPSAPAAFTATPADRQVDLSWSASIGATGYNVKRTQVDGGLYEIIATNVTDTAYADTGLTNGTTYYYVVSAINSVGESADSTRASATPLLVVPSAPAGLSATSSSTQVRLVWNETAGANSYTVKRSWANNGPYEVLAENLLTPSYLDTGLTNGSTYYYKVSASNDAGEGSDCSPISATPLAPAPLRIMCVGDSITAGYTDNPTWNVPFQFGYRSGLYTRLTQAGYGFQFVGDSPEPWNGTFGTPTNTPSPDLRTLNQDHHRGYGGQGTSYVLSNIANWLASDDPNVVLLMIGINDLGVHQVSSAKSNLNSIVNTIVTQKPDAQVIVAQITPGANNGYVLQEFLDYNTYIRETLVPSYQTQGKHVTMVDQYANFPLKNGQVDPALFSNSINHPTATAYDRMAQTWLAGIQSADYANWSASYPGFVLTDPGADTDGDGLSNKNEYAFGLDPTRGSSSQALSVTGTLHSNGTFHYTRRATSALNYSVWTSTDLKSWTRDTSAFQTPGVQVGETVTVAVTLGSSPTADQFFVRVQAE
jgi:uncharacterized repeat protein (TIGR02543 family)